MNEIFKMPEKKTIISEAEFLANLNQNSDEKLVEVGFTKEEIEQIRDYKSEFKRHAEYLNEFNDDHLKALGYNSEQMNAIRNYIGSGEQMILLSGRLSVSIVINSKYYENETSHIRVQAAFNWIAIPVTKFTDMMAFSWANAMTLVNHSVAIQYTHKGNGAVYYGYDAVKVNPNGPVNTGVGFKFSMRGKGAAYDYYYAKSGTIVLLLETKGHINNFAAYTEYGHYTVGVALEISFSAGGGSISFKPEGDVEVAGQGWTDVVSV